MHRTIFRCPNAKSALATIRNILHRCRRLEFGQKHDQTQLSNSEKQTIEKPRTSTSGPMLDQKNKHGPAAINQNRIQFAQIQQTVLLFHMASQTARTI